MAFTEQERNEILRLINQEVPNREIARRVLGRVSRESSVRSFKKQLAKISTTFEEEHGYKPKILVGDVECSCSITYTFNRFRAFISPEAVEEEPYLLTFAGKWLNNPSIMSYKLSDYPLFDIDHRSDESLVKDLHALLDECDIFIAHNANFDKGWMNQRFAVYGLTPPSPYKVIDTLRILKKEFSLPSNSLKAAAKYFNLENQKLENTGIELWIRCMKGDRQAFDEMETYNIGDILALEELYLLLRPWMKDHPNVGLYYQDATQRCVKCGSENLIANPAKTVFTSVSEFPLYQCLDCGGHNRLRVNIRSKDKMKNTLANVL